MLRGRTHGGSGMLSACATAFLRVEGGRLTGVSPGIHQAEIDLETGEVGEWEVIWEGTGGEVSSGCGSG